MHPAVILLCRRRRKTILIGLCQGQPPRSRALQIEMQLGVLRPDRFDQARITLGDGPQSAAQQRLLKAIKAGKSNYGGDDQPFAGPIVQGNVRERARRRFSYGSHNDICHVLPEHQHRPPLGSHAAGEGDFSQPKLTGFGHRRIAPHLPGCSCSERRCGREKQAAQAWLVVRALRHAGPSRLRVSRNLPPGVAR
jgi:hypothetical protein